jgi:serine/threonine protein kinase
MPTSIEAGTTVSHYRVIAPLGAGGMGEVYKAHDVTLERTVALKILPPELVKNDERVRRFIQEAKSASSLNHPNIVTIHEIGIESNVHYIAMELVDGATLRRRIHDDTDLRTLLVYLAQAADGVAKAHAAGIVHRDLKPENIMVTRDGFAKVLDFGLAKLSVKKSAENTSEATVARQDTREGALLGTVGYMSPEQVQGKPVDHRSDIFSFGGILYEAATKQRPFSADSDVDVMHKILHDKPTPIDEINPTVPAELRRVIRRCMAKDPEKRYQSMKDLALELGEIVDDFEELSASATSASHSISGEALQMPGHRANRMAMIAVSIVALIAIGVAAYLWRQSRTTVKAPVAYNSMDVTRLTSSGNIITAAISPDGKYVAYTGNDGGKFFLTVRQIATGTDVPVVTSAPTIIRWVTYSPDGDYLYYIEAESTGPGYQILYRIPALGGQPRKIAFDVDTAPAFSPDGKRIAWGRGYPQMGANGLIVANIDGTGERELLRTERAGESPTSPSWTPDGQKIIISSRTLKNGQHAELLEVDAATSRVRTIGPPWHSILDSHILPDASGVVMTAFQTMSFRPQIWIQPYPDGAPVRVTNDVAEYLSASPTADGKTLAAVVGTANMNVVVSDVTDESGGKPLTAGAGGQVPFDVSVSPKDGAVVFAVDRADGTNIAMIDAPGALPRMLTTDGFSDDPKISANHTIAFRSRPDGGVPTICLMDADGGNVRKLVAGQTSTISPDARFVAYQTNDATLYVMPAAGGAPRKIT